MHWARIAPPFGAGVQANGLPDRIDADEARVLWDSWHFSLCDDACTLHRHIVNTTVWQGAPAVVSRGGLPLPAVTPDPDADPQRNLSFVVLTKFPSGPIMVTAMGRTAAGLGWHEPRCNITIDLSSLPSQSNLPPIALFGTFGHISFKLGQQPLSNLRKADAVRGHIHP